MSEGKKNFTFCLHCKGVPDMYFSMDEEDCYHAWVEKLHTACNSGKFVFYERDRLEKTSALG